MRKPKNLRRMKATARRLLNRHGLKDWRFAVEDLGTELAQPAALRRHYGDYVLLGITYERDKFIFFNWHYPREFRQTVLHEIAHALRCPRGRGDHDRQWAKIARAVGCTPKHVRRSVRRERRGRKASLRTLRSLGR